MTEKTMETQAEAAIDLHYKSTEAQLILGEVDWDQHWPVVDAKGFLTGDVIDCDATDWANVDDMAAIDYSELTKHQIRKNGGLDAIRENGYVNL